MNKRKYTYISKLNNNLYTDKKEDYKNITSVLEKDYVIRKFDKIKNFF